MIRNMIARFQGFDNAEQRDRLLRLNSNAGLMLIKERFLPTIDQHSQYFFYGVARDHMDDRKFIHDDNVIKLHTWFTPDSNPLKKNFELSIESRDERKPRPMILRGALKEGGDIGLMHVSLLYADTMTPAEKNKQIYARLDDLSAFAQDYLSFEYDRFNPLMPGEYLDPRTGDALEPERDPRYRSVTQIDKEIRLLEDEVRASRALGQDARDVPQHLEDALHAKHAERDENFLRSGYARIVEYRGKWTRPQSTEGTDQDLSA